MMTNTAAEKINKINEQQAQTQVMKLSESIVAQTTKNTVLSEALYTLRNSVPGYTETIQIPSEEEGQFDYVVRFPEDSDEAPVLVLRSNGYVQVYFEYKVYKFDLLDPNLDEEVEILPAECLCVNPYDLLHDVAERISREIRYNDLALARRKYRNK